jgi:protein phosphatase
LDAGVIQQADVKTHRFRNRLTKLLGDHAADVRPDVHRLLLEKGDCLLLCTDGLTDMVDDATIAQSLRAQLPAADTCQLLIDEALKGGGRDNVTVIVARYTSFAGGEDG